MIHLNITPLGKLNYIYLLLFRLRMISFSILTHSYMTIAAANVMIMHERDEVEKLGILIPNKVYL